MALATAGAAPATRLTFSQIEDLWTANGGAPGWAPFAAAIAIAESSGNTQAYNGTGRDNSVGLWQINYFGALAQSRTQAYGSPSALLADPNLQAQAAIKLSGNGADWTPWETDAAYAAWRAAGSPSQPSSYQAQRYVAGAGASTPTSPNATPTTSPTTQPGANGGLGQTLGGLPETAPVPPSGLGALNPGAWVPFAVEYSLWGFLVLVVFVIGLVFVIIGLALLAVVLAGPVVTPVAQTVGGRTPFGRAAKTLGGATSRARDARTERRRGEELHRAEVEFTSSRPTRERVDAENAQHKADQALKRQGILPPDAPAAPRSHRRSGPRRPSPELVRLRGMGYDREPF